ncbi:hypothetical protein GM415_10480 [Pseudodesulfovibrio cashew]|uniref:Uncharacterized protein n=1 Tax=Pseudodesulfovibrio cashew TaxID=2678688 RepID=A0A6I6JEG2_9BACT|nr:hypothetical protein [Pseudodesulfovibrio cashew]QGY40531.1 hypothetical protein GM415_10480 [Pseudodesulfovibrio cashew]
MLCVYEMEGAIAAIRSPFSTSTEYADRKTSQYESESEKSARDRAYVIFSRLQKYNDLYTEMRSVRQRCRVVFGDSYTGLFDDLWSIIIKIRFSAEMLGDHYWTEPMGHCEDERRKEMSAERQKYEQVIWSWGSSDEVEPKVKKIVAEAERLFREKITPSTIGQRICNA